MTKLQIKASGILPGGGGVLVTIPFPAQAILMPGGPLGIPCPGPLDCFCPSPTAGRSLGWGRWRWRPNLLFVYLRSGLFANYPMGLYLNKNQFLAAPPLLLGSAGAPV